MYVHLLWIILLFTFQNKLDVFQYLTDVDVNTTVDDDLISEVCPIVIILWTCSHFNYMHNFLLNMSYRSASYSSWGSKI